MNNNENDEMLEQLKLNIAACKFKEEQKLNTLENKEKGGTFYMKKKIIMVACACLVLVSGIVAAKTIKFSKNSDRGLGEGVDTAVENGYIANPEMDFVKFDDKGPEIKIENFIMDDTNLSVNFLLKSNESMIDFKNVYQIELNDLIVRDEENRIIFGGNSIEAFNEYCKENNLNYKYAEFNENYMNCGLNTFIEKEDENCINLTYNIYSNKFPKSKKLYFSFRTITLYTLPIEQPVKYELKGSWKVELDVPEKMYNRSEEYYKVVSCTNKDFNVYTAKVTDTGFEIGVIISNLKRPEENDSKLQEFCTATDQYNNGEISKEEYEKIKEKWYYQISEDLSPISVSNTNVRGDTVEASYVENINGERFKSTLSPSRRAINQFIDENHFCFYETFSMTKYNATDKIKVVLNYYGKPITIELEKIK